MTTAFIRATALINSGAVTLYTCPVGRSARLVASSIAEINNVTASFAFYMTDHSNGDAVMYFLKSASLSAYGNSWPSSGHILNAGDTLVCQRISGTMHCIVSLIEIY